MSHYGSRNVDDDPHEPEAMGEERLWKAVFRQGILDACSMTEATARAQHDNSKARDNRRKARMWFEQRCHQRQGWMWTAKVIRLTAKEINTVHKWIAEDKVIVHPFVPKAQAEARLAGLVKKVRKTAAAVKILTGQLSLGICDNTPSERPRPERPARQLLAATGLEQQSLW